jgi:acetylornithine/N-succinyldiaminopimelate aminotransferase
MGHGTHGSTFGGNPLACSVGCSVLDLMNNDFFSNLSITSTFLIDELNKIINDFPEIISEVRGKGLMLGIKCKVENTKFVDEARNNKMLTIKASDNVVRLLPPLNISIEDCESALSIIRRVCKNLS